MARLLMALACLAVVASAMADTGADLTVQNEEFMVSSVGPQRSLLQANRHLAATYTPRPVCYWPKTNNGDELVVVVKTTNTAANAVTVLKGRTRIAYIKAGSRLRASVSPFGRLPKYVRRSVNTFRFTVKLPLTPCAKGKQNLRLTLRKVIRAIKTGSIRSVSISRIR